MYKYKKQSKALSVRSQIKISRKDKLLMGKIFINKSTKNTSVGGVSPSKSNDIINKRLQELKNDLAPQKKQETSLDNIDAVIGRPNEKIIPRDLLIAAPKEWNFFPKARNPYSMESHISLGKILRTSPGI